MNLSLLLREDSVNLKKARIQFTRDETYFSYFTNLQTNLTREVINISLIIKAPTYIYDCEGNKLDVICYLPFDNISDFFSITEIT